MERERLELTKVKELVELKREESKCREESIRGKVGKIEALQQQMAAISKELAGNQKVLHWLKTGLVALVRK